VLSRGPSAASQPGCTSGNCSFLHLSINNFPRNSSISVECNAGSGYYFSQSVPTNGSGAWSGDLNCWSGYANTTARVDGNVVTDPVNFAVKP
jgi:hypothetical protein